jgi:uncharacterized phage-associated protein
MGDDVYEAADVAVELRRRLPGVGVKKLHKLLYYCQGHHLADVGRPLFAESIAAWDMGPVVGKLWKSEQVNPPAASVRTLDHAALNTIGYVVSRYGALTGRDLEILSHGEQPWARARQHGQSAGDRSPKVSRRDMTEFFRSPEDDEDVSLSALPPDEIQEFLREARERFGSPARPDDLGRLKQRLMTMKTAGNDRC